MRWDVICGLWLFRLVSILIRNWYLLLFCVWNVVGLLLVNVLINEWMWFGLFILKEWCLSRLCMVFSIFFVGFVDCRINYLFIIRLFWCYLLLYFCISILWYGNCVVIVVDRVVSVLVILLVLWYCLLISVLVSFVLLNVRKCR